MTNTFQQSVITYGVCPGTTGCGGGGQAFANLYDVQAQLPAGGTAENAVLLRTTLDAVGIFTSSPTTIQFLFAGNYNVAFSIQFLNTDNKYHDVSIWLKKNGTNVPDSNSIFSVPLRSGNQDGKLIAVTNYIVNVNQNDEISLYWFCNFTTVSITNFGVLTNPSRPETPSVIVTISQI